MINNWVKDKRLFEFILKIGVTILGKNNVVLWALECE